MSDLSHLVVRAARMDDLDALYELALQTGGGLTNLPPDRDALQKRLQKSSASYAMVKEEPSDQMYLLMLEDVTAGKVIGTANIFSQLGTEWPFYSFRMTRLRHASVQLQKTLTSDVLHLVNDFDGATEVGGLFVDPAARKGGAGRLLARARYLFIAQMRQSFADRVVAELRGFQDAEGIWPFWEAVGQHFFDMPFEVADKYNSLQGNQFIADLMPKYPIYVRLLPPDAQAVIGVPNREGEAAFHLLQKEGFRNDGYVDIFDAGPTVHCDTDALVAIKDSELSVVSSVSDNSELHIRMICAGKSGSFRATAAPVRVQGSSISLASSVRETLGVSVKDEVRHVAF
jgi:arginine N-succinyltransferase